MKYILEKIKQISVYEEIHNFFYTIPENQKLKFEY